MPLGVGLRAAPTACRSVYGAARQKLREQPLVDPVDFVILKVALGITFVGREESIAHEVSRLGEQSGGQARAAPAASENKATAFHALGRGRRRQRPLARITACPHG